MREIRFRGKAKMPLNELDSMGIGHTNGWVYGNLIQNGNRPHIVGDIIESTDEYINHEWWVEVYPESVGQFVEMHDVYEGDIIKNHWFSVNQEFIGDVWAVKFGEHRTSEDYYTSEAYGWYAENSNGEMCNLCQLPYDSIIEILGTVFEDSELLGK